MPVTIHVINKIDKAIASGIQIGARTHSHDQLITLQSFSTMKATVRRPRRLMPPVEVFEFSIVLVAFVI